MIYEAWRENRAAKPATLKCEKHRMATTELNFPAEFAPTITGHKVNIIHDDGLHRYLRCANPESGYMSFHITTWPGHLCISGDMGTYVFSRVDDMFCFHRAGDGAELYRIPLGYWAEKLHATNTFGSEGHEKFSRDLFTKTIRKGFKHYVEGSGLSQDEAIDLWREVHDNVLRYNNAYSHISAAHEFKHNGRQVFPDFWEEQFFVYTYRFLWCCHAIRWAIREYDIQRAQVSMLERARRSVGAAWGCLRRGSLVCLPS